MSLRGSRARSPRKTETCSLCYADPLSTNTTFSRSSSLLPHAHARDRTRTYRNVQTLSFCSRLHHDTTFKLVVAHPAIVRIPVARITYFWFPPRRISTTLFFDRGFDINTLYPREYITGLPSNTHTNALRPPTIRRCSTGIYAIVIYDIANYF